MTKWNGQVECCSKYSIQVFVFTVFGKIEVIQLDGLLYKVVIGYMLSKFYIGAMVIFRDNNENANLREL